MEKKKAHTVFEVSSLHHTWANTFVSPHLQTSNYPQIPALSLSYTRASCLNLILMQCIRKTFRLSVQSNICHLGLLEAGRAKEQCVEAYQEDELGQILSSAT